MNIHWIWITPLLYGGGSECISVAGVRIHASDLAAKFEVFSRMGPDVEIGFAPYPGTRRILTAAELQRAVAKHGIVDGKLADVCVQMIARVLTSEEISNALQQQLRVQGYEQPTLEVMDFSKYPVPEGKLEFLKSGYVAPKQNAAVLQPVVWRGRMVYGESRSVPIWAKVRISVDADVILAARNIAAATTLSEDDITTEKRPIFPAAEPNAERADNVVGKRARRAMRKGELILPALLENPRDIERGDKVEVAVISGLTQLRLDGIAESSGQAGERILVRNPSSGKRFRATIESKGHVSVEAISEDKK